MTKRPETPTLTLSRLDTPVGAMLAVTDTGGALCALDFADFEARTRRLVARHHPGAALIEGPAPEAVAQAVRAYFEGDLGALARLPTRTGGTEFQRRVWAALRDIPAGQTRSYGQLATAIGAPRAVRAVGLANGQNPIGVAVPCHRVIGASGALTGYAGGVERKRWLLRHEGVDV